MARTIVEVARADTTTAIEADFKSEMPDMASSSAAGRRNRRVIGLTVTLIKLLP